MKTLARTMLVVACVAAAVGSARAQTAADLDARIVQLVGNVSEDRLVALLKKLETFGTRNTLSRTD